MVMFQSVPVFPGEFIPVNTARTHSQALTDNSELSESARWKRQRQQEQERSSMDCMTMDETATGAKGFSQQEIPDKDEVLIQVRCCR
jgi:hypothetical protein